MYLFGCNIKANIYIYIYIYIYKKDYYYRETKTPGVILWLVCGSSHLVCALDFRDEFVPDG